MGAWKFIWGFLVFFGYWLWHCDEETLDKALNWRNVIISPQSNWFKKSGRLWATEAPSVLLLFLFIGRFPSILW